MPIQLASKNAKVRNMEMRSCLDSRRYLLSEWDKDIAGSRRITISVQGNKTEDGRAIWENGKSLRFLSRHAKLTVIRKPHRI